MNTRSNFFLPVWPGSVIQVPFCSPYTSQRIFPHNSLQNNLIQFSNTRTGIFWGLPPPRISTEKSNNSLNNNHGTLFEKVLEQYMVFDGQFANVLDKSEREFQAQIKGKTAAREEVQPNPVLAFYPAPSFSFLGERSHLSLFYYGVRVPHMRRMTQAITIYENINGVDCKADNLGSASYIRFIAKHAGYLLNL
jgi:hypothetical protein